MRKGLRLGIALAGSLAAWAAAADAAASHVTILPGKSQVEDILAAEKALGTNPDDPSAARAVGPNNFRVYCHRADREWLEGD